MARAEFNFEMDVLPLTKFVAARVFHSHPERSDRVNDAVSEAWEAWNAYPHAPPSMLATFAVRRVKIGRQFGTTQRSVDSPVRHLTRNKRRVNGFRVSGVDMKDYGDRRADPADLAALRIDFTEFRKQLTAKKLAMLDAFLEGATNNDIVAQFGVTHGRASQVRRELWELWHLFTA